MNPHFFESAAELHQWFLERTSEAEELWVGIYKKESGRNTVSWEEVREEALCFGWAEGLIKPLDSQSYAIRLTPRKPGSKWSLKNVEKARALIDMGLMDPEGLKAFAERDLRHEEAEIKKKAIQRLAPEFEERLRSNAKAWQYFEGVTPSYRKQVIRWVMSAKQASTRERRFRSLIDSSEKGLKVPPMR